MLDHQIEFSKAIQEIYKPISGRASDPNSLIPEGNLEGIKACEEYEAVVNELKETLKPELEMLETRIIQPAIDLLAIVKQVQKMLVKRNHKLLDYDRTLFLYQFLTLGHRTTVKKLQDKKEKTLKDEKALFAAENALEVSTQDYNYFNDMMKEELPRLFELDAEFIRPLFQNFYYMQLNIFYTLDEKMRNMEITYFDFTVDVEEQYESKRGDIKEQAEVLSIVHFKGTGRKRISIYTYST
jgi:amphiphysin